MNFTDIFQRGLDEFFPFDEWAEVMIRIGIKIWNYAILSIVSLLQLDLETYAGGAGMDFARSIHTVFLSVSAPLLVVIFFWHVYELSYEDRKQGSYIVHVLSACDRGSSSNILDRYCCMGIPVGFLSCKIRYFILNRFLDD